jgi:hypothetical protein
VQPVIDAGLVDPVDTDMALAGEVLLRRTPGHTRGDADPDAARTTRRAVLAAAATTDALVLGTHFAGTTAGRILSTDQSYRFVPQP